MSVFIGQENSSSLEKFAKVNKYLLIIKVKLISKPAPATQIFQFVSPQHLNFEIQILLER